MDPRALYVQLGRLIEAMPDLDGEGDYQSETLQWMGRASALIAASGVVPDSVSFNGAMDRAISEGNLVAHFQATSKMRGILYRALAMAELNAPADAQGAFIPAGSSFDALAAVAKVFGRAKSTLLVVDPYLDEKALLEFALMVAEHVAVRLLGDEKGVKPGLRPAVERWRSQYDKTRPMEVRIAASRSLHDRLIIVDDREVWILTQSLNALAARSPASIVRVEDEAAALKLSAYRTIWDGALAI